MDLSNIAAREQDQRVRLRDIRLSIVNLEASLKQKREEEAALFSGLLGLQEMAMACFEEAKKIGLPSEQAPTPSPEVVEF